ncbi:MAG: acetylornithine/N-succinyldiaminopimelate aminotransferase [Patiriisocius sp.]
MKERFLNSVAQTSPHPLAIEVNRASGTFIWDKKGKRYYDLVSGIAVCNIGHCHPKVVGAVKIQLDKYMHVMPYGELVQEPQVKLAETLNDILPEGLDVSYFVNSGAEAIEASLKLAKRYTGRTEIISFNKSYHGNTHGALSVSGNESKKYAFRPLLPGVKFIDFDVPSELMKITEETATVIIEPIQGDAGVRVPSVSFMKALRAKCDETGALLIFDEIQTGFGRTGKMFALEHFDIQPDILALAKGLGGGMPIGAFVSSKKIMTTLTHNPMLGHITTFGGHPVNCAAAIANIDVLRNDNIVEDVERKGAIFESMLQHASIIEIRRKGLMLAIEFNSFETVERIVKGCLEKGVITFWFLSNNVSFRLQPPLTISDIEIKKSCEIILQIIEDVS